MASKDTHANRTMRITQLFAEHSKIIFLSRQDILWPPFVFNICTKFLVCKDTGIDISGLFNIPHSRFRYPSKK